MNGRMSGPMDQTYVPLSLPPPCLRVGGVQRGIRSGVKVRHGAQVPGAHFRGQVVRRAHLARRSLEVGDDDGGDAEVSRSLASASLSRQQLRPIPVQPRVVVVGGLRGVHQSQVGALRGGARVSLEVTPRQGQSFIVRSRSFV